MFYSPPLPLSTFAKDELGEHCARQLCRTMMKWKCIYTNVTQYFSAAFFCWDKTSQRTVLMGKVKIKCVCTIFPVKRNWSERFVDLTLQAWGTLT